MKGSKHTKRWFLNRVGKEIVRTPPSLFNPPILVNSLSQAVSLYITQAEKGYTYSEA